MARINIEECWWSDPRRTNLLLSIGFEADSAAVNMWRIAQEFWSKGRQLIPIDVFHKIQHSEALTKAGLADIGEDGMVYVRGSSEWLEWTNQRRAAGSDGGKASAQRPRDEKGRLLPKQDPSKGQANTKQTQASDSGSDSGSRSNPKKYNIAQPDGFAEFWSGYPRKVGKGKAEKAYRREVKSGTDPAQLIQARDKYRDHLKAQGTEAQYIKHGSTFMNEWRDWLDPETGKAESFAQNGGIDWAALEKELT